MKTPVTITMLIVGGFLLLAPFVFNALHEHEMAMTYIARTDLMNLSFGNDSSSALSSVSRFGCWFTGTGMIIVAMIGAAKDSRQTFSSASKLEIATA